VKLPIYLDNHATTKVDPRVLTRMLPFFQEEFGNAASRSHVFGWKAEAAVEAGRKQVAELIGATEREIIFTSGATESNNIALLGAVEAYASQGDHVITQQTEHKAVLDVLGAVAKRGVKVTYLPVSRDGLVDPGAVAAALTKKTILVSIMAANNEVGVLQPVEEIGRICLEAGVLFHTDAAQAAGKIPFDVETVHASLVSVSAHKLYGPKGIGALYVRRRDPRVTLAPVIFGGGHERGLRSGTLNVPGIVGFGEAARLALAEMGSEAGRLRDLRDRLLARIRDGLDGVELNGHAEKRLPGNLNVSIAGVDADALMMAMKDIALSSGSACTSATLAPSHVLKAMGLTPEQARGSLRFGLGRFNTAEEIAYVAEQLIEKTKKIRSLSRDHGSRRNSLSA